MAQSIAGLADLKAKLGELAQKVAAEGNTVYEASQANAANGGEFVTLWQAVNDIVVARRDFWTIQGAAAAKLGSDIDAVTRKMIELQSGLSDVGAVTRDLLTLADQLAIIGTVDPPPPPPPPAPAYPWAKLFKNGKAPNTGRAFLSGMVFGNSPEDQELFTRFMGCAPDAVGGGVLGGNHAAAEAGWDGYATRLGTDAIRNSDHCQWIWTAEKQKTTLFVPCNTSAPHSLKLADWQDIADGKYAAKHFAYGKAMAETFKALGLDTDLIVFRPDWEMNQDTGFRPAFFKNGGTIALWVRMITAAWRAIGEGLGFTPQVVFSPARQPAIDGIAGYEKFLDCEVYTAVDCSHHPAKKNTGAGKTELALYGGPAATEWSPGLALEIGRKRGLPVMICETSVGYGWKAFGDANDITPAPADIPKCWELFGKWANENAGIGPGKVALVMQHSDRMLKPNFCREVFATNRTTDMLGYGPAWEALTEVHKKYFGRVA